MNLIAIIDSLVSFQYIHAEELSRSVIKSNQVGEEWLVPDSEDVVHVHLFPVVGDYGYSVRSVVVYIQTRYANILQQCS